VSREWTVPSLPTRTAILAVRARIGGAETLLRRTGLFSIEGGAGAGLAPLSYHGAELWIDPAGRSTPVADVGLARNGPHSIAPLGEPELGEDDPPLDAPAPDLSGATPDPPPPAPPAPVSAPASRAPLVFPRRE